MLNVTILGKGSLAINICKWFLNHSQEYHIQYIVPVIPEPKWDFSLSDFAKTHNLTLIPSGHYKDITTPTIEFAISVFYDKIIKVWFINKCDKIINIHNGPLPKYRGMSPINWSLKNNESEHGITIHEITPGIDDGPIIAQLKYSIYPDFEEVIDVYKKSLKYGYQLFEQTMPILYKIKPQPQSSDYSYYSKQDNTKLGNRLTFNKNNTIRNINNE